MKVIKRLQLSNFCSGLLILSSLLHAGWVLAEAAEYNYFIDKGAEFTVDGVDAASVKKKVAELDILKLAELGKMPEEVNSFVLNESKATHKLSLVSVSSKKVLETPVVKLIHYTQVYRNGYGQERYYVVDGADKLIQTTRDLNDRKKVAVYLVKFKFKRISLSETVSSGQAIAVPKIVEVTIPINSTLEYAGQAYSKQNDRYGWIEQTYDLKYEVSPDQMTSEDFLNAFGSAIIELHRKKSYQRYSN